MNEKLSLGASGSSARVSWTLATGNLSGGNNYDLMSMAWDMGGSFSRETDAADLEKEGILKTGDIYWAGFCPEASGAPPWRFPPSTWQAGRR